MSTSPVFPPAIANDTLHIPVYTNGQIAALQTDLSGNLKVNLTVGSLSLPTGSAGTPNSSVLSIQGIAGMTPLSVTGTFWPSTQPVTGTFWQATQPVSGTFWQTVQPISGTITANAGTGTFAVEGLGLAGTPSGGLMSVQGAAGGTPLPVSGTFWPSTQPVSGTFWQSVQPVSGTFWQAVQPISGTVTANAGTGTFATNLTEVGGTSLTLGQQLAANSLPVILPAATISALTPLSSVSVTQATAATLNATVVGLGTPGTPSGGVVSVQGVASGTTLPVSGTFWQSIQPVSGTFWQSVQPVNGTVTANAGTGNFTVAQSSAASLNATIVGLGTAGTPSGGVVSVQGVASGTTLPVSGTFWQSIQPVSGTFWQSVQPVSGTFWQATQPISGTVTANAGTGIFATNLTEVGGAALALGQQLAAASLPVVLTAAQLTALTPFSTVTVNQGNASTPSNAWPVKISDGTNTATLASLTNAKALAVEIVDSSGNQITTFGGVQYTEGTTQASPVGTATMGLNPSNVLNALALDASGNLKVNVVAGGSSGGGTSSTFGSTFPTLGTAIGASDGTSMQPLEVESTTNKNLRVGLYNGGIEALVTTSQGLRVTTDQTSHGVTDYTSTDLTHVGGTAFALGAATASASLPVVLATNQPALASVNSTVPMVSAAWTSATALNTVLSLAVTGFTTAVVSYHITSASVTGGAITFEASDDGGTTWYSIAAASILSYVDVLSYALTGSVGAINAWQINVSGFTTVRIRLSTAITGTGTANLNLQASAASATPSTTVGQSNASSLNATVVGLGTAGTPSGGVVSVQGVVSGIALPVSGTFWQATQPVSGTFWPTTQPVSGTVTANAGTGNFTVIGLGTAGTPSGGVVSVQGVASGTALPVSGTFWQATQPVSGTFWQTTQPVSGTITANAGTGSFTVAQATAANLNAAVVGNVASGNTDSGNGVKVSGVYTSTPPTFTTGQRADLQVDTNGNLKVNVVVGGGSSGGLSVVDESAWTAGTSVFTPIGGVFNDSATALTSGQEGSLRLTTDRAAHVNLRTSTGIEFGTSGNPLNASVVGAGTAGTPSGGVVSVQGVASGTALPVSGTFWQPTQPVSGTFWQATQPISGTVTANAGTGNFTVVQATAASLNATIVGLGVAGTPSGGVVSVQGVASGTSIPVSGTFWQATQPVSGTFWQVTQPVSGTFWQTTQPVSGSGNFTVVQTTAASLNATVVGLGTAGAPSGGVISVQGVASGTALPVSGTFWQATQPVSGSVTTFSPTGATPTATLASTAAAYTVGWAIGTTASMAFSRTTGSTGILESLTVMDSSNTKPSIDFILFSAAPQNTPANATAWSASASDFGNVLARVNIPTSAWQSYGSVAIATVNGLGIELSPLSGAQTVDVVAIIQTAVTLTANCINVRLGTVND